MSITAYKIEAAGHDRTGKDFGYVNIMYRYGNKQSCPRPDPCQKWKLCGRMRASTGYLLPAARWAILYRHG